MKLGPKIIITVSYLMIVLESSFLYRSYREHEDEDLQPPTHLEILMCDSALFGLESRMLLAAIDAPGEPPWTNLTDFAALHVDKQDLTYEFRGNTYWININPNGQFWKHPRGHSNDMSLYAILPWDPSHGNYKVMGVEMMADLSAELSTSPRVPDWLPASDYRGKTDVKALSIGARYRRAAH